jgi:hypothetical protein
MYEEPAKRVNGGWRRGHEYRKAAIFVSIDRGSGIVKPERKWLAAPIKPFKNVTLARVVETFEM